VRKRLVFKGAERAKEVQRNIQARLNEVRAKQAEFNFKEMIDTGVYGQKPSVTPPQIAPPASSTPGMLLWLLPENPQYTQSSNTLIWHPHWVFLPLVLLPPVATLIIGVLLIWAAAQFNMLATLPLVVIGLLFVPACIVWIIYNVEDHVNDVYILTPTNVIDVEKKPWGPEDRRSASIGAIQNITTKTSLISRWIGFGDVFLETAGRGEFTFHNVPDPRMVVRMINTYQDNFRRGDKERAMKDTLSLIRYYHNAEQERREESYAESRPPRRRPSSE
jgi:hypothetical protein